MGVTEYVQSVEWKRRVMSMWKELQAENLNARSEAERKFQFVDVGDAVILDEPTTLTRNVG